MSGNNLKQFVLCTTKDILYHLLTCKRDRRNGSYRRVSMHTADLVRRGF